MPPRAIVAALVLSASSWTLTADTYPRQHAVDAIHYRFALTVADDSPRIEGEAAVTVRLLAPAREVALDLASPTGGTGMTVTAVSLGGRAVAYAHEANRLRLPVPESAKPGADLVYDIRYAGTPADGLRATTTLHGDRAVFSDNWPDRARHWLPLIDHPYDKATGELIVTAPAQFQVVSNGRLVEEIDLGGGWRRTHWKQSVPIASWLYALGVARFDVHHAGAVGTVPLQTWVFPQDRAQGRAVFEDTSRRALEFFTTRIGPYPYEKLANVQAAGIKGAMENATAIFYGDKGVASGRAPVVHEIAHQWFGNSVTERDWDDVWLSEGFATYFALLFTEHGEGRDAFVQGLLQSRRTVLDLEAKRPGTPVVHDNLADMRQVLNQLVYQKGGWILHMLRAEIGTDAFWTAIREYYRRYRDQNASTDEFRQVAEEASGRDLGWFFDQWLTRGGSPRVDGRWRFDPDRQVVELVLSQPADAPPFRLIIDIGLVDAAGVLAGVERRAIDAVTQTILIPAATAPAAVSIDPNTWLLADVRLVRAH